MKNALFRLYAAGGLILGGFILAGLVSLTDSPIKGAVWLIVFVGLGLAVKPDKADIDRLIDDSLTL